MISSFRKYLENSSLDELLEFFYDLEDDPNVEEVKKELIPFNLLQPPIHGEENKIIWGYNHIVEKRIYQVKVYTSIEISSKESDEEENWKKIMELEEGYLKSILMCFSGERPTLDLAKETPFIKWIESSSNFRLLRFSGCSWGRKNDGAGQSKWNLGANFQFLKFNI